jgi:hypothetical protein
MEMGLHRALKALYGSAPGARLEVHLDGFRIDVVDETGRLVEIQSGALGPLRGKLARLLPSHQVRVVKPVILEKRVVRRARIEGPDCSARRSPKCGTIVDVFEDLVGLAQLFPHRNLTIEVVGVSIDEIRIPRRRRPGYQVADRRLRAVHDRRLLRIASDLWELLPDEYDWTEPFTTAEIARRTNRPLWIAQRIAYCLRLTGASMMTGKRRHHILYRQRDMLTPGEKKDQAVERVIVGTV